MKSMHPGLAEELVAQPIVQEDTLVLDASVIVVGYNSCPYLPNLLDSVQAANPAPCEVILVDNASQDGTAEFVAVAYPQVTLLPQTQNLGFAAANNLAAARARGKYLIFINPDARLTPGSLLSLLGPLEAQPDIGLSTAKIHLDDRPEQINAFGNDIHISGLTLCRYAQQPAGSCQILERVNAVSGAAFAIRRDLFMQLGGFDPGYFMYMEDTDLSLRARLEGYTCVAVPEALVYHDYQLRFGPQKTYFQERNRYRLLLKHLKVGSLLVMLPALLLAELVTWGFILLREPHRWRNKLRAYKWIVSDWQELRKMRAKTQKLRRTRDRELLLAHGWRLDFAQTGDGTIAHAAGMIFNPLFGLARLLIQAVLWW